MILSLGLRSLFWLINHFTAGEHLNVSREFLFSLVNIYIVPVSISFLFEGTFRQPHFKVRFFFNLVHANEVRSAQWSGNYQLLRRQWFVLLSLEQFMSLLTALITPLWLVEPIFSQTSDVPLKSNTSKIQLEFFGILCPKRFCELYTFPYITFFSTDFHNFVFVVRST